MENRYILSKTGPGVHIANATKDGQTVPVYMLENDGRASDWPTSKEGETKIFQRFLEKDKKLTRDDIAYLCDQFEKGETTVNIPRLSRKYEAALGAVQRRTCGDINFGAEVEVFPVMNKKHFVMSVFGTSQCGKSYFITQMVMKYPARGEGLVYLMTPSKQKEMIDTFEEEEISYAKIDLLEFRREIGRNMDPEDFIPGSIVIMDDIETFPETYTDEDGKERPMRRLYTNLRTQLMERGMSHQDLTVYSVSHRGLGGKITQSSVAESTYYVIFPRTNPNDVTNLLEKYGGLTKPVIRDLIDHKYPDVGGWVMYAKIPPKYAIWRHGVMALE